MEIYPGIKDKFAYFAVKLSLLGTVHRLVLAKTKKQDILWKIGLWDDLGFGQNWVKLRRDSKNLAAEIHTI